MRHPITRCRAVAMEAFGRSISNRVHFRFNCKTVDIEHFMPANIWIAWVHIDVESTSFTSIATWHFSFMISVLVGWCATWLHRMVWIARKFQILQLHIERKWQTNELRWHGCRLFDRCIGTNECHLFPLPSSTTIRTSFVETSRTEIPHTTNTIPAVFRHDIATSTTRSLHSGQTSWKFIR